MTTRGSGLVLAALALSSAAAAAPLEKPSAPELPPAAVAPVAPATAVPAAAAASELGALAASASAAAAQPAAAQPAPEAAAASSEARRFDGAAVRGAAYSAVVAAAAAPAGPLAVPAVYALSRAAFSPRAKTEGSPLRRRLGVMLESHVSVALPFTMMGAMLEGFFAHSAVLPLALAGYALAVTSGMEDYVAYQRRRVVGGWQASHDQRYRVDPATGRMRDVRGRKIGEDRYEMYAPGGLTRGERLWIRLVGLGMGAACLQFSGAGGWWLFSAAAAAGFLVSDLAAARHPDPFVPDAEDKAHAARFNED